MKKLVLVLALYLVSLNVFALELKSEAFKNNGYIPDRYTCDGKDASPQLSFSDIPANAKSLALICEDPDAPFKIWVHWVLFNIPAQAGDFKENVDSEELKSKGIIQGVNDFGRLGYNGPCPPQGKAHRYFFNLYALDNVLSLKEGATKKEVIEAMQGHIIAEAKIAGLYQRQVQPAAEEIKTNGE